MFFILFLQKIFYLKVFLHGPLETPDVATQRQVSENELYMKLYVTALSIYTSPEAAK